MAGLICIHLSLVCAKIDDMATSGESMLDLLNRYADPKDQSCSTAKWIETLGKDEQTAFEKIKENNQKVRLGGLFTELSKQTELPFKLTSFRSHFRGYCSCKK